MGTSLKVTDLLGLFEFESSAGAIRFVIKDNLLRLFLKLFIRENVISFIALALATLFKNFKAISGIFNE